MVEIRRATVDDVGRVAPLFDAYRQFYGQRGDPDLAAAFLTERLEREQSVVLLAVDADASATGFTQLYRSFSSVSAAPILILNDLFVVPKARRVGVGGRLLDAAREYGRRAGAVRLTLTTAVDNEAAQALYVARGWERDTEFWAYNLAL
jgi:GNAT superfamily N-acetyltransferase